MSIFSRCQQNCLPRVNVNEKLSYETNCNYCTAETAFKWKVGKLKSCDGNPLDPNNMDLFSDAKLDTMMFGDTTSFHMVFHENALEGSSCYTCTLRATNPNGKFGENSFTVRTNSPPTGGKWACFRDSQKKRAGMLVESFFFFFLNDP